MVRIAEAICYRNTRYRNDPSVNPEPASAVRNTAGNSSRGARPRIGESRCQANEQIKPTPVINHCGQATDAHRGEEIAQA